MGPGFTGMRDSRSIAVSCLAGVVQACRALGATRAVSILDPGVEPPVLPGIARGRHLALAFHDISRPSAGYVAPGPDDVAALAAFGRSLGPEDRVVVHCAAGVSRSPACAAVVLCAWKGPESARRFLLDEGPFLPNGLILRLGDGFLGTGGVLAPAGKAARARVRVRPGDPIF